MLVIQGPGTRLCDGISRRDWMHVGGLGLLGLSLPRMVEARRSGGESSARSCILVFLFGGPPQHETWDPKPDAPAEIRGPCQPIASRTPGLLVGEWMPLTARITDRIAVLRAVSTDDNAHSSSGYYMLTGHPHLPMNRDNAPPGAPNDRPCLAAVVRGLGGDAGALPAAFRLPEEMWNTGRIVWPGQDAGLLGKRADPWLMTCDPNAADFRVPSMTLSAELPALRLDRRRSLLQNVDSHLNAAERWGPAGAWDGYTRQAFDLLQSPAARQAFELEKEPPRIRDRYGRTRFGQSLLLARRLVEAGVSMVQVNWTRGGGDDDGSPAWDTHADHARRLKTYLMPPMDQAYSALLEDLAARGLLEETLVVWMGEFGRTPRINARAGRDHWGHVFSVALAGGGIRGGAVHGASDSIAAYPLEGLVRPEDLAATILHALGIDPHRQIIDPQGRPMTILEKGRPLHSLFG